MLPRRGARPPELTLPPWPAALAPGRGTGTGARHLPSGQGCPAARPQRPAPLGRWRSAGEAAASEQISIISLAFSLVRSFIYTYLELHFVGNLPRLSPS